MEIECNRCANPIMNADKTNASYIISVELDKDKVLVKRMIIICKKCRKESDKVIW